MEKNPLQLTISEDNRTFRNHIKENVHYSHGNLAIRKHWMEFKEKLLRSKHKFVDPKKCVSVFNLNYTHVKDDDLKCLFSIFGHVTGVKIAWKKKHCISKGYGFIYFSSEEEARIAQREVNGMGFQGRIIRVEYCLNKPEGHSGACGSHSSNFVGKWNRTSTSQNTNNGHHHRKLRTSSPSESVRFKSPSKITCHSDEEHNKASIRDSYYTGTPSLLLHVHRPKNIGNSKFYENMKDGGYHNYNTGSKIPLTSPVSKIFTNKIVPKFCKPYGLGRTHKNYYREYSQTSYPFLKRRGQVRL